MATGTVEFAQTRAESSVAIWPSGRTYGSILGWMNIHLPPILMFTKGVHGFDPRPFSVTVLPLMSLLAEEQTSVSRDLRSDLSTKLLSRRSKPTRVPRAIARAEDGHLGAPRPPSAASAAWEGGAFQFPAAIGMPQLLNRHPRTKWDIIHLATPPDAQLC